MHDLVHTLNGRMQVVCSGAILLETPVPRPEVKLTTHLDLAAFLCPAEAQLGRQTKRGFC